MIFLNFYFRRKKPQWLCNQKNCQNFLATVWNFPQNKRLLLQARVTQPPWLHQFCLGWTQVHPNYWMCCRHWGWVKFFFPSLTSRLPIKKSTKLPKHFKPQLPTSAPPKTLNLATQEQKQCYKRWCYRSDIEVLPQKTMLQRRCWSNVAEDDVVEAMLKWCYRRLCWSGVAKNAHPKDN